ncbi:MAG: hypothetical protein NC131_13685 [Roseburia sp.]|nr:hypothetical protein [Roseburia sp.]
MPKKSKRSDAQKKADEKYSETNRRKNRENQKNNYANLAATFPKADKTKIQKLFKRHGVSVAEVLRAAAYVLQSSTTTAEQIKQAAQMWTAAEPSTDGKE